MTYRPHRLECQASMVPATATAKARAWAAVLVAEGWAPSAATARARAAYGLRAPERAPEPVLSREWLLGLREQLASERPGVDSGRVSVAEEKRQSRARLAAGVRLHAAGVRLTTGVRRHA